MRQIEREANFRPFEGKARVFLIDEADKLNDNSSRTLESSRGTTEHISSHSDHFAPGYASPNHSLKVSDDQVFTVDSDDIEQHLLRNKLADARQQDFVHEPQAEVFLVLSGDIDTFTEQRKAMLKVLEALTGTPDRAQLLKSSEQLNEVQYKDEFEQRLDVLETLIRDAWMLSLGAESNQLVNEDLSNELRSISQRIDPSKAAAWILEIEDMREQLVVNINRKPGTDALFLTMASGEITVRRISVK
jgi:DNA polymerase-3 subunit delta'